MASVRIEAAAFTDVRFEVLARRCGLADSDHGLIKAARLWQQCTARETYVLPEPIVCAVLGSYGVEALIEADLGERVSGGVRLKGTTGRIEWLGKVRANSRKGGDATRAKWGPSGPELAVPNTGPSGSRLAVPDEGPLTLTPTLTLVPDTQRPSPKGKDVKQARAKRGPTGPSEAELASVRVVLDKLGERNGVAYRGSKAHERLIVARLREGHSEMDLRIVSLYCADKLGWRDDPKMVAYLRPETLYGATTIERYIDAAKDWYGPLPETGDAK